VVFWVSCSRFRQKRIFMFHYQALRVPVFDLSNTTRCMNVFESELYNRSGGRIKRRNEQHSLNILGESIATGINLFFMVSDSVYIDYHLTLNVYFFQCFSFIYFLTLMHISHFCDQICFGNMPVRSKRDRKKRLLWEVKAFQKRFDGSLCAVKQTWNLYYILVAC